MFPPNVEIIAHEYVRNAILTFDVLHREPYKTSQTALPAQIDVLKKQVADEKDAARKAPLQKQLATRSEFGAAEGSQGGRAQRHLLLEVILHKGQRDIQLLFLGRGHTGGDTVVFLPKEGIVCTGDLMESRIAYMGDAFFDEWITTLDALKKLDFKVDLPGHGVPFGDKGLITAFQSYITDITKQAAALRQQGVSADDAAKRVNLTSHAKDFRKSQTRRRSPGVRRIYAWMDERGKK